MLIDIGDTRASSKPPFAILLRKNCRFLTKIDSTGRHWQPAGPTLNEHVDPCSPRSYRNFSLVTILNYFSVMAFSPADSSLSLEIDLREADHDPRPATSNLSVASSPSSDVGRKHFGSQGSDASHLTLFDQECVTSQLLSGFLDAVVMADRNGIIVDMNNAAESMFEISKVDAIGEVGIFCLFSQTSKFLFLILPVCRHTDAAKSPPDAWFLPPEVP